jgi:predicted Zn-dependent protease
MTLEQNPQNLSPTELLHRPIGGQPLVAGIELHQAGLKGYSGLIPGNAPKRVAVIQHGAQDYLFVAAVRGRVSLQSQDELLLNVIKSFRPMTRDDYPQAQPLRLHMVKIKAGQTLEAIVKGSKLPGDALKTLRLLNNLYPSGQPRAGDWLKVVR